MVDKFAQCKMINGDAVTTGFIPLWAAKVGNTVELPELDGENWLITSVGTVVSQEQMRSKERAFKDFQGSTRGGGIDE